MSDPDLLERMRADWNARACEDANYYVAFGRHQQQDEEFFATAADVVRSLEEELQRLPPDIPPHARRALEIGCGPGRLMRPMSRNFGEIHGVDVSDEMIRLAAEKLRSYSWAHVHHTRGADLAPFRADFFDFVYSYAVFQHIPSRQVVWDYFSEIRRVLKVGGIFRGQLNGLLETAGPCNTWEGVRIPAEEVAGFARDHDFQLLALEGAGTQYMWTTWRKQPAGWRSRLNNPGTPARIRGIGNSHTGEPVVPASGRFACVSLWMEQLPPDCDLNHVRVTIDGRPGTPGYIGPPMWDGLCQLNVALPPGVRTGLAPVEVAWLGKPLCPGDWMRIIPPGPAVPRVHSVTDGVNLLSGARIESRAVKIVLEDVAGTEPLQATVDGEPVRDLEWLSTDAFTQRFELNFKLPETTEPGSREIELRQGARRFPPIPIEVA